MENLVHVRLKEISGEKKNENEREQEKKKEKKTGRSKFYLFALI